MYKLPEIESTYQIHKFFISGTSDCMDFDA